MRHVEKDRCGYSGYACVGVDNVDASMRGELIVGDSMFGRTDDFEHTATRDAGTVGFSYIDNFLNIPTQLRGMVTTWKPIKDMSDSDLVAPEVDCRTDLDPFTVNGFLDYFIQLYSDRVDARAYSGVTGDYVTLADNSVIFTNTNGISAPVSSEGVFEPGIIEPTVDTQFSPVSVIGPTAIDYTLDGIMIVLVSLMKWRLVVDKQLDSLAKAIGHIWGMRSMLNSALKSSICDQFKLVLTKGSPIQWTGRYSSKPKYKMTKGTALINGGSVKIGEITDLVPPFYLYFNIKFGSCNDEGGYDNLVCSVDKSKKGQFSLGIGGVREVEGSTSGKYPKYTMWQIVQERCEVSADVVRTCKSGVLWRTSGGGGSRSPYKVLDTAQCDV